MADLTRLLALPVTTRYEAETFIRELNALGLMHHFDDGAIDCLYGNGLVTLDEAAAIDRRVALVYAAWKASGADMRDDCPIGYCLGVLGS